MERFRGEAVSPNERLLSVNEAAATIHGIMAEISPTGAVDSERSDLGLLLKALQNGTISPQDAVRKARKMQESRNLDH